MTRDEIIRLVRNLVAAETEYASRRTAYEGDAHNAALRFEANDAWNDVQRARRAMAGIDARDLLRALTLRSVRQPPEREPGKRYNIRLAEMQDAIQMLDAGTPLSAVALFYKRDPGALRDSINAYRRGISALAREAKANGTWEATRGQA
jgi:hypothetical protein